MFDNPFNLGLFVVMVAGISGANYERFAPEISC
jgi:hypothetical protein